MLLSGVPSRFALHSRGEPGGELFAKRECSVLSIDAPLLVTPLQRMLVRCRCNIAIVGQAMCQYRGRDLGLVPGLSDDR